MTIQNNTIVHGLCLPTIKLIPDESVDSIVTDPPYGLGDRDPTIEEIVAYLLGSELDMGEFMHKDWDLPSVAVWKECFRVLKPGAFLFCFAGTRTQDILSIGIRAAGFENRDVIPAEMGPPILRWIRAQGMPKSTDLEKVILGKVLVRYGTKTCCCTAEKRSDKLDQGVRDSDRNSVRCKVGATTWNNRILGSQASSEAKDPILQISERFEASTLCGMREDQDTTSKELKEIKEPLLFNEMLGGGTETSGYGDSSLWSGLEGSTGQGSSEGQSMPDLRSDSRAKRVRTSCPSPEALSVSGNQSTGELSSSLRELPSQDRINYEECSRLDSNQGDPRRVILDSEISGTDPVARICSWCGLPDPVWLGTIQGFGTALKPYWEPILVFRKPIKERTVANQVLVTGTGGINIEASRVKHSSPEDFEKHKAGVDAIKARGGKMGNSWKNSSDLSGANDVKTSGRYPPNLIMMHSDLCRRVGSEMVAMPPINRFNDGAKPFGGGAGHKYTTIKRDDEEVEIWDCHHSCPIRWINYHSGAAEKPERPKKGSKAVSPKKAPSGASKYFINLDPESTFFYVPKPSQTEKNEGLDPDDSNEHATVKPVRLMEYLVTMATPTKGLVLDPYCGSGTTCVAAVRKGFDFIGIEKEVSSASTAQVRVGNALRERREEETQREAFEMIFKLESE